MIEPHRSRAESITRWVAGGLLVIPLFFPLLVGTYDRNEPEIGGFPFYFWYQFLWIFIGAVLTVIAYCLLSREKRSANRKGKRGARLP